MKKRYPVLVAAAFLFVSPGAFCADIKSDDGRMPVQAIARAAYNSNPALASARESLKAVQELYPQALANWQPTLNASAGVNTSDIDNSNFGDVDGTTTKDVLVSLNQPLYRGGRTMAQQEEAKRRIDAQYQALRATEQRVLADALVSGLDVVYGGKNLALQIENENLYRGLLDAIVKRRQAGETTETEVNLATTRLTRASADRLDAETELDNARTRFEEAAGIQAGSWSDAAIAVPGFPSSLPQAVAESDATNPEFAQARFLTAASNAGIRGVRGELFPLVNISASWAKEWDPQPGIIDDSETLQAGVRASVPLYEGGAIRSRVRQAKNELAQRRYAAQDIRLQAQRNVISQWRLMTTASAKKSLHEAEVHAAEAARKNLEAEVFAGEKTLTDLLEASQDWLDARAALLGAQQQEQVSTLRVSAFLGLLTPQALGFDGSYDPRKYARAIKGRALSDSVEVR